MPVRVEVLPYIEVAAVAGVSLFLLLRICRVRRRVSMTVGVGLWIVVSIALCLFFRDPERTPPQDPMLVVSGADGVVDAIQDGENDDYLGGEAVRITVFLNLHNVHVNRAPIAGRAVAVDERNGRHLAAYLDEASELNQCTTLLIEGETTQCVVRQLVGAVVRRIVNWVNVADTLERGERIGMMKFGSRLDVMLPREDVEVLVSVGDRVKAGETPIARILSGESE